MDGATEAAMASLLPKLAELLKEEQYRLPTVIREDIEFVSNELTRMQRHAVDWPRDDEQAGLLAKEARGMSNRVEKLLEKKAFLFKKSKAARQLAGEIREVKDQVQKVATHWCESHNQLNAVIVANPTAPAATTSIDPRLLARSETAGIQDATEELINTLLDREEGDMSSRQQLKVVSISAGFGGLGEPNIAKAAYDRLQERYDCSAFVSVGQNPDMRKVFRNIMFSLNKKRYMGFDAQMLHEKEKLIDLLGEMLENKRYLIVVDDIHDSESWDDINRAWVGNAISNNGSAVVMRRCIADVALGTSDFHTKFAPLAGNQSTRLFRQPPFGDHCPHEFAEISDMSIENCSDMQQGMAKNMASLLPMEQSLPMGVKEDVEFISGELAQMQHGMADVPRGQLLDDEQARLLVNKAKDLYNCMEKLMEKKDNLFNKGKAASQIASEIREVKLQVEEVTTRWSQWYNKRTTGPLVANLIASTTTVDPAQYNHPEEMVGIQEATEKIIKTLSSRGDSNISSRLQLKIVSISGFGGLGKTTLAKAAYDRLQERYEYTAFVSVGQNPDTRKVFRDIMFGLNKKKYMGFDAMKLRKKEELIGLLRGMLESKRYLIVLDDIWDSESWDDISRALVGNSSSAVVMTSRNTNVARGAGGVHMKLAPLARHHSTRLFLQTAFGGSGDHCLTTEFADISEKVVEKCSGMPLAIVTIASLLKGKPLTNWRALQESNYFDHSDDMKRTLALSYTDLPGHLRRCLLYFSMFNKGCEVSVDRLLWGWIAEEGLFEDPGPGQEDNAIMRWRERGEHYLRELINRGLVEAVDIGSGGRAVSCRVCSDIVHDLIVSLSASENFATILDGQKSSSSGWLENTLPVHRRLSIQQGQGGDNSSAHPPPEGRLTHVKSLVVSGNAACMPSLSEFGAALHVLDLCDVGALQNDRLEGVARLSKLKCLAMRRGTGSGSYSITGIPVLNLQVLDLRATCVEELPESMATAVGLKCLRVDSHTKIPAGMLARMVGLEELEDINVCKPGLLAELRNLKKLMVLGVAMWSWDESYDDALVNYLTFLSKEEQTVRSLSISACCSLQFLHKLKKWAPPHLQNLEIKHSSALTLLPGWIPSLQKNLTSLSLEVYKLSHKIIDTLGNLQNLLALCITSKHNPEQDGRFTTDGFRNLTSFNFVTNVMGKIFEPGAMRKLTRLRLSFDASNTKQVSPGFDFGLENLPSLEHTRIKIICFGASRRQVEDAEVAISRALRTASLEIQKVRDEDMLTEDGNKEEEQKPPQSAAQVERGNDESNKSPGSNDGKIAPDPCVQPNANESDDKVNLLGQLMVDNMNLRLELLNHDSRVNDMLRDIRLKDAEIVQAAIDRVEDFMKQNVGQRLPDKSNIVENHSTQNISKENMCTEQDDQTTAQIGTSEISELINASIYYLRHKCPRDTRDKGNVYLEKTEVCQLLQRDGKHAMSKGAIEKGENKETAKNYLNHDMIFLPLNSEQHWYLAVVSAKQHEIQVLDSVSSTSTEREELKLMLKGMETCLELAANEELNQAKYSWPDYKVTTWNIRLVEGLPKQEDSSSCGLFMLKYMEYWTGDMLSMKFVQDDINQFRRELASMLVNSPLNKIKNTKETEGCVCDTEGNWILN